MLKGLQRLNNSTVLIHAVCWIIFGLFILLTQGANYPDLSPGQFVVVQITILMEIIFIFYLNYLWIVPRYIITRKNNKYYILILISLIAFGLCLSLLIRWMLSAIIDADNSWEKIIANALSSPIPIIMFIVVSTGIRLIVEYQRSRINALRLEETAKRLQLEALKSKINPHFLYNAFNTLYALSETKSNLVSSSILQLSGIMRYLLNNSGEAKVFIWDELDFIESYINFQKLRVHEADSKIFVEIERPNTNFLISPMLLLSFVENAFKYSNLNQKDHTVRILFEPVEDGFVYQTMNHISAKSDHETSGVGNESLRKILNFEYQNAYEMRTWISDNVFNAYLKIRLN